MIKAFHVLVVLFMCFVIFLIGVGVYQKLNAEPPSDDFVKKVAGGAGFSDVKNIGHADFAYGSEKCQTNEEYWAIPFNGKKPMLNPESPDKLYRATACIPFYDNRGPSFVTGTVAIE